jgi:glutamate-1-semialdehyde 2,1-aminomutase
MDTRYKSDLKQQTSFGFLSSLPEDKTNGLITNFTHSKELQKVSHALIPGGAHTYAKGDDQYPEMAPAFITKGKGCHVWDMDGNEFIEYGMGLRAVTLGHAYEPVVEAAYQQMLLGSNFTRPASIEVECAEKLVSLIPGAEMIKFAKNGSDVTTAAVKLARAYTGRDLVAICADQPFFSTDDWFIGTTAMTAGIPDTIRQMTVKFRFNDIQSLENLFAEYPGRVACVIMEVETADAPKGNFLNEVQRTCQDNGALLIFDEMITGFRWHLGGAQTLYGVSPDLSTFGKALGNGFSISALVGKRETMQLGGLQHDRERVFLLSQTHGAENHTLAAAIATMKVYETEPVVEFLTQQGDRLSLGLRKAIHENNLDEYVEVLGRPCNLIYVTRDQNKERSQEFRTLFLQEIIKRGIIAPSFVVSYSHTDEDIDRTIEAAGEALAVYRKALDEGIEKYLIGRPVKPVFRKFN